MIATTPGLQPPHRLVRPGIPPAPRKRVAVVIVLQGARIAPLRRHAMPGPLPGAEAPFGRSLPPDRSRSALVVSHHLDGLLHRHGHEPIAARSRQGFTSAGGLRLANQTTTHPHRCNHPRTRTPQQVWPLPSETGLSPGVTTSCRENGALCCLWLRPPTPVGASDLTPPHSLPECPRVLRLLTVPRPDSTSVVPHSTTIRRYSGASRR